MNLQLPKNLCMYPFRIKYLVGTKMRVKKSINHCSDLIWQRAVRAISDEQRAYVYIIQNTAGGRAQSSGRVSEHLYPFLTND